MRFALIATSVAAAVAVPFAVAAAGPQMSSDQFLSAVRCTAYQDAAEPGADLAGAKWALNAEARRQSPDTAARASAEAGEIARTAVNTPDAETGMMHACASPQIASGAEAGRAV